MAAWKSQSDIKTPNISNAEKHVGFGRFPRQPEHPGLGTRFSGLGTHNLLIDNYGDAQQLRFSHLPDRVSIPRDLGSQVGME